MTTFAAAVLLGASVLRYVGGRLSEASTSVLRLELVHYIVERYFEVSRVLALVLRSGWTEAPQGADVESIMNCARLNLVSVAGALNHLASRFDHWRFGRLTDPRLLDEKSMEVVRSLVWSAPLIQIELDFLSGVLIPRLDALRGTYGAGSGTSWLEVGKLIARLPRPGPLAEALKACQGGSVDHESVETIRRWLADLGDLSHEKFACALQACVRGS